MWFLTLLCLFSQCFASVSLEPARNRMVKQLVQEVHKKHHIPTSWLDKQFKGLALNESSLSLMQRPFEAKPWYQYRQLLVSPKRVQNGTKFMHTNQTVLRDYEKRYHIPASIVTAIIGIETSYGENMGDFITLEALSTLAFYYTPRADYFRSEAIELLRYAYDHKIATSTIKGSYAGAIGIPQFMPSNIELYGRHHGKDGQLDLVHDHNDAIASVFNYLAKMGHWASHKPIMKKLELNPKQKDTLNNAIGNQRMLAVTKPLAQQFNLRPTDTSWIIRLESQPNEYDFYRVFGNFKSIMRYNNSVHYSAAVAQLAQQLANSKSTTG
jgi:membrane-bound lytic murein transglycosylase B